MLSSNISPKSSSIPIKSRRSFESYKTHSRLTSQQLDVWEHAALLYHAYEWQAAADTFAVLAQTIDSSEERALCLLNAGLARARLGDYELAANTFSESSSLDRTLLVTTFLIGLVSYESGDLSKAEACFDLCWDELGHGAIDYNHVGLDFTLGRALVHHNLREVRRAHFIAGRLTASSDAMVPLGGIPAEYIFEAPPRPEPSPETIEHRPSRSMRLKKMFQDKKMAIVTSTPSERGGTVAHSPKSPESGDSSALLSSPLARYQERLLNIQEDDTDATSTTLTSLTSVALSSPVHTSSTKRRQWPWRRRPSTSNNAQDEPSTTDDTSVSLVNGFPNSSAPVSSNKGGGSSWHRRPSFPYTPRGARVENGSARELVSFIHRNGNGPRKNLIPRDAKGEYESVEELARFVQLYAPEKARDSIPQPLNLNPRFIADLRMEQVLNRKHGVDRALLSPDTHLPSGQESLANLTPRSEYIMSPRRYSAPRLRSEPGDVENGTTFMEESEAPSRATSLPCSPAPISEIQETMLELVQPMVHKPHRRKKPRKLSERPDSRIILPSVYSTIE